MVLTLLVAYGITSVREKVLVRSLPRLCWSRIKRSRRVKVSRSAKYYQDNPEARKKKGQYDKKYHSTPARRRYRSFLNRKNREAGTYGNGDGKDWDHGLRKMIKQALNRSKK